MKLQNILDLSTFEITRFRIWNQTSQPSDKGLGSKYFNTNSGHEAYGREQIYTPIGWRTAAYMDDIEAITNGEGSLGMRVKALEDMLNVDSAETVVSTWAEIQAFLDQVQEGTDLMTLLDDKLSKSEGGTMTGLLKIQNEGTAWISFRNASVSFGSLGMNESGLKYWDGSQTLNVIHSGNIGDYALKIDGSNKMKARLYMNEYAIEWNMNNTFQLLTPYNSNNYKLSYYDGSAWKTIAFTDSDITGNAATASIARNLKSTGGKIYAYFSDSLKYTVFGVGDYDAYIDGTNINFRCGESLNAAMLINSSGNVGIGPTNPQYKLDVAGTGHFTGAVTIDGSINSKNGIDLFSAIPYIDFHSGDSTDDYTSRIAELEPGSLFCYGNWIPTPDNTRSLGTSWSRWKNIYGANGDFSNLVSLNGGALIPTGKNMMFGDASGNAIMEYDADANAIKVTGNFYATGTVASGGKAQEGTGTGGSATVYPFTLTYGQAAYQIANPKSDTNVIVQVYEWNATTSSWDLILTDVNVTASKITVTFGRTTTVNHMVTVV